LVLDLTDTRQIVPLPSTLMNSHNLANNLANNFAHNYTNNLLLIHEIVSHLLKGHCGDDSRVALAGDDYVVD
jgi:hypothetical protein